MNAPAAGAPAPITVDTPLVAPSVRRRMTAWLYEGVLMFGMVVLPGLIFGVLTNTRHALDNRHGQPLSPGRALARYLLAWIWFLPPLAAMAPFSLTGGEVTVLMTGWVAVWALLSRFQPQRQFWHDIWAGTRLIDVQPDLEKRRA